MEKDFERLPFAKAPTASEALNDVSTRTLVHMLWRNKLPAVKVGDLWCIREAISQNLLEEL